MRCLKYFAAVVGVGPSMGASRLRSTLLGMSGALVLLAPPALAQVNYPTAAGASVKVPGVVPLQCNSSGQSCAPVTSTNPAGPNQVVGNVAHDGVDSGNPVKVGGVANASTPAAVANADRVDAWFTTVGSQNTTLVGQSGSTVDVGGSGNDDQGSVVSVAVRSTGQLFDGTNEDRARSIINATNSVGAGITAAGVLAQLDDTSPTAVTENQFGNLRMGAQRQLLNSEMSPFPYSAVLGTPAVAIRGASGNVANAAATATLTGTATTTVYLSGFTCTPGGATAAALVNTTVTGPLGGTLTYTMGAPAGAAVMGTPLDVQFNPAIPASAVNTTIVVSMPALGAGNTNAACVATGFYM